MYYLKMQTLVQPDIKIKIATFGNGRSQVKEKLNNPKIGLSLKFYQKLLVILLTSCIFLIFPESPYDSEVLCERYHSKGACIVW